MSLVLYGYWRSSSAWRVRIALHHKELDFRYVPVNLLKGEQHAPEFLQHSPRGEVPVLEVSDGDTVRRVTQSLAIIELLEELYPARPLLPKDPWARAAARELAQMIASGIQPLQNLAVAKEVKALGGDERAWTQRAIARGLTALEARAQDTAGTFMIGDAVSLADACLVPQLYAARRFGVELGAYPTLVAIEGRCAALGAFARAHADAQPDAVQ